MSVNIAVATFRGDLLALQYRFGGLEREMAKFRKDFNVPLLERYEQHGKLPALVAAAQACLKATDAALADLNAAIQEAQRGVTPP